MNHPGSAFYKEDLSAPSPRTRFTVRRFGGSFGA